MCKKHSDYVFIISATLNPAEKSPTSHSGVSPKTTNCSCVASRCQLCQELLPVGYYYQRTWQFEIFWWNICTGCFSGSLQMAQPEAWNGNHRPCGSPICCFPYFCKISPWCVPVLPPGPQGSRGRSTDTHTPGRCRFPKQGLTLVSWRVYHYSSWVPYTLKVFRDRETPCFYLNRSNSNADFLSRLRSPLQLRCPLWVWVGPRASKSRGMQRRQTALESSCSTLTDRGSRQLENGYKITF